MEDRLCCIVNKHATCSLCNMSFCKDCWINDKTHEGTPIGEDVSMICPVAQKPIKWPRYIAGKGIYVLGEA